VTGLLCLSAALLVSCCKHCEGAAQERGCMLVLFLPQNSTNTASTATPSDAATKVKLSQRERQGTPPPYPTPALEEGG
jgi:hypothetical protein